MNITRTVFREDHEMFRDTVRRFLEKECLPRQAQWDEAGFHMAGRFFSFGNP